VSPKYSVRLMEIGKRATTLLSNSRMVASTATKAVIETELELFADVAIIVIIKGLHLIFTVQ
jgi:hypothetical protein